MNALATLRCYACPQCGRIVCYTFAGTPGEEIECPVCKTTRFARPDDPELGKTSDAIAKQLRRMTRP